MGPPGRDSVSVTDRVRTRAQDDFLPFPQNRFAFCVHAVFSKTCKKHRILEQVHVSVKDTFEKLS